MACRGHTGGQKYCTLPSLWEPVRATAVRCSRWLRCFPDIFFVLFQSRSAPGARRPVSHTMGSRAPLQEKSGSGQKSWLRARQPRLAGSGILSLRAVFFLGGAGRERCLRKRAGWPLSCTAFPYPAPGEPSRQEAARHRKRAPEDRGPCRRWSVRPSGLGGTR